MEQIPDDPRIRDAELNVMPSEDPVKCPVCGEECDTVYLQGSEVIGCENCIDEQDAWEWREQQKGDYWE